LDSSFASTLVGAAAATGVGVVAVVVGQQPRVQLPQLQMDQPRRP